MADKNTPRVRCPQCGEMTVVRVVYGLPAPSLFEAAERDEVILGGCVVEDDEPSHGCTECGWLGASTN